MRALWGYPELGHRNLAPLHARPSRADPWGSQAAPRLIAICVFSPAQIAPAPSPTRWLCVLSSSLSPGCASAMGHSRSASSGELGSHPLGVDPRPRLCKRLGFGSPALDLRLRRGSDNPLREVAPAPKTALLSGATQGAGTSLAVPLEFADPLKFPGTLSISLCCNALVRHWFQEQKLKG